MVEVLAIIPARGGSKSIPRKNIRPFAGHPLIAYSIAAGLKAELVTRVIVSTDDKEIAQVAREYGAEVPFLRPEELAQDSTTDFPVFEHALSWLAQQQGYRPEIVVQLRPTSPVRPPGCVDQAVSLLLEHPAADSVRGVVLAGQDPHKMWRISRDGRMLPLLAVEGLAEPYNTPRQALPVTYWQTGHIDAIRAAIIFQKKSLSGDVILPLVLDDQYTVDIDTPTDWQRAEWLVTHRARQGGLAMVHPGRSARPLPEKPGLVVFDFDGVMTDDRVWTDQDGRETVAASRSDGMGVALLRRAGIDALVISTESNPVVTARCQKLKLPVLQSVVDKAQALTAYLVEHRIDRESVVYLGNDINDLSCLDVVGCFVAVADAHARVLSQADLVLSKQGGHGAVRELCDMLITQLNAPQVR
jgi:YrbI family 3-deoxy-D-manno-octulosonate 8-phosphate phosphatase